MLVFLYVARWICVLFLAWFFGKLITKIKMPAIIGWLISGMILGPFGFGLIQETLLKTSWYQNIIIWTQCSFGLILGTELVWNRIRSYGKALVVTTLTQSLGTFIVVSIAFGIILWATNYPIWLSIAFGGIALATAPAPVLSIVKEFHTKGPVTDTLLPMAILDDIVGIIVFFTVNSYITSKVSGGDVPIYMIPIMILLPIGIGILTGIPSGKLLKKKTSKSETLIILIVGITATALIGMFLQKILKNININYMLMGVSYSTVFSNMLPEEQLNKAVGWFQPILAICLIATIVDLGSPLDYHLIIGAGAFTFVYMASRAFGKYFGARLGAKITDMPKTVQKYLGLTLLPHSGVSLVFTGVVSSVLAVPEPNLASLLKGTIAAAAVINEIIAVLIAKKGFELSGEISK